MVDSPVLFWQASGCSFLARTIRRPTCARAVHHPAAYWSRSADSRDW